LRRGVGYLDINRRKGLLHLGVVPGDPVHRFRDIVEHQVEVEFVRLIAARVEAVLECHHVRV